MSFSENLRQIRKEKNLSQEAMAELFEVSRQAVSKWEQDNSYPETEKLIQIALKLDISLDSLLLDRKKDNEINSKIQDSRRVFAPERKIFIQSYDGTALSQFYKFTISKFAFPGKNEPKCILGGVDKRDFWGDHCVVLGYYATEEDAQAELDDIYRAIRNDETTYRLKHYAKVKIKAFSIKIVE